MWQPQRAISRRHRGLERRRTWRMSNFLQSIAKRQRIRNASPDVPVTGAFNVTVPTLTVFPAQQPGNGTAMLVFPGGGFSKLAIDLEGSEVRDWLTSTGTTCVLVKYHVPKSGHHYDEDCHCAVTPKHLLALQVAQRAIRPGALARQRAQDQPPQDRCHRLLSRRVSGRADQQYIRTCL